MDSACSPFGGRWGSDVGLGLALADGCYLPGVLTVSLNWAMEERRSPANVFSSVAAAAACFDPTAYAATHQNLTHRRRPPDQKPTAAAESQSISLAAVVVSSTIPEICSNAPTTSRASPDPTATSRDPCSDATIVADVSA